MILAALAPVATSLTLYVKLRLTTAAAAAALARAAPCVTDLNIYPADNTTTAVAAATLIGLMGVRLHSLALFAPNWDVDALGLLGACRELQHLAVHGLGGRLAWWCCVSCG